MLQHMAEGSFTSQRGCVRRWAVGMDGVVRSSSEEAALDSTWVSQGFEEDRAHRGSKRKRILEHPHAPVPTGAL